MSTASRPRIGLVLGSGSARGWAHIGVIRALADAGIEPDAVCGTSIGALVGAAYAAGELDRLEAWVRSLRLQTVVRFLDVSLNGGLIKGEKLITFFREHFVDRDIQELGRPFGAVATDLARGGEVWLREGGVSDAVRASIALPGLFTPAHRNGVWLVDGGLVNPVPVSLARAMGADVVIAVDLNSDLLGRHLKPKPAARAKQGGHAAAVDNVLARIQSGMSQLGFNGNASADEPPPPMLDVVASSINIMQVFITRRRLAGEPADVLVAPRLASFGLMEFHRAASAIDIGRRATEAVLADLRTRIDGSGTATQR
jgi:NTE family protein